MNALPLPVPPPSFQSIAAMAANRVIGRGNQIPWHLPEDFKWFKQTTMGQVLVMGRKTYESIGRPLPGRETVVLSRSGFSAPGVRVVTGLAGLPPVGDARVWFICGGAEIYQLALPQCTDLWLTRVKRDVPDGDAFFPAFEGLFELAETVRATPDFDILHYRRRAVGLPACDPGAGS